MRVGEVNVLDQIRELGRQMMTAPERFTGNVRLSSMEGGVTGLTVEASIKITGGPTTGK